MNSGYFYAPYSPGKINMNEHVENLELDENEFHAQLNGLISYPSNKILREELEDVHQQLKVAEARLVMLEDLEIRLYEEYDKKVKEMKDYMVTMIDKFLKKKNIEYISTLAPAQILDEALKL
jgi:3-methyladenine DNA glycosylase AlkD